MDRVTLRGSGWKSVTFVAAVSTFLAVAIVTAAGRTVLQPGWNMFSTEQDIEVGQQVSVEAERQLSMLGNDRVDRYVNALGRRLAAKAPGETFPYAFKVVNDRSINAFALPGGPVYINRGVIEAAINEAQLAGVLAHETAHVALRHGTNQASKAAAGQVPLAILGGMIGSDSIKGVLAQLGASFAMNSVLLKYSRTAETQADIMGTQILYDAGHDPRAMAQFFEIIEDQQEGGGPVEFFSNHPNPDNRIERVDQEVAALGGVPRNARTSSREFDEIKRALASLPAPAGQRRQTVAPGDRPSLRILSARYGAKDRFFDVRERLQSRVQDNRLDLEVNNSAMGGDPIRQDKTLEVQYQWDDRVYTVSVRENERLFIPTRQQTEEASRADNGDTTAPDEPSERFVTLDGSQIRISYPDNWRTSGRGDAVTITPRGGLVDDGEGNQALAYGVIVNLFEPRRAGYGQGLQGPGGSGTGSTQDPNERLELDTDELVQELRLSNRNMRVIRHREAIRVDDVSALSTYLSNDSPAGGRETNWLVTLERPDGLLFLVFAAPEREFQRYEGVFHQMLRSVRIKR